MYRDLLKILIILLLQSVIDNKIQKDKINAIFLTISVSMKGSNFVFKQPQECNFVEAKHLYV